MARGFALYNWGANWSSISVRRDHCARRSRCCWRWSIGLFSLRVRAIFFAMITLAVASVFAILASQLGWLTGGEDGRTYQMPELLRPGFRLVRE